MKVFVTIAGILLLLALLGMTEGLQCYQCEYMEEGTNSTNLKKDRSCESGIKPRKYLMDSCPTEHGGIMHCLKQVGAVRGMKFTMRGCAAIPTKREGCEDVPVSKLVATWASGNSTMLEPQKFSGKPTSITQCWCSKDQCNSANIAISSLTMMALSAALISDILLFPAHRRVE